MLFSGFPIKEQGNGTSQPGMWCQAKPALGLVHVNHPTVCPSLHHWSPVFHNTLSVFAMGSWGSGEEGKITVGRDPCPPRALSPRRATLMTKEELTLITASQQVTRRQAQQHLLQHLLQCPWQMEGYFIYVCFILLL